jgi:hypothetical protein
MDEDHHRAVVEAAYARLRETLEAKDVSVEGLRAAALEALNQARIEIELDPDWLATELMRLSESGDLRLDVKKDVKGA